jgi:hypothetical protein
MLHAHHWRHVVLIIGKPAFETQPDTKSKQQDGVAGDGQSDPSP